MKRCIICGNLGDDDSTVCEVCGNPYMDLEDDAQDRMEMNVVPDPEPETEVPEPMISEPEIVKQPEAPAEAEAEVSKARQTAPAEHRAAAEAPGQPEEQAGALQRPAKSSDETAPGRMQNAAAARSNSGRRMKSGPQIYGQASGQSAQGQTAPDGMIRRNMNGNARPAGGAGQPTSGPRRPVNGNGQPMQNRPVNGQSSAANGRPMNGPGRQMQSSRPVNGPGQPMQGRPMNGSGQGMQGRPMNGPGQPMQNRPMNAPQQAARAMGFRNMKIREMSKKSFRSPIFLLIALLQTVYLAGSIAAIFMKQLNFSQIMRLITSISMPSQITGYMDQILKLMAKLDTDAVLANLVIRIPDLLMCLGLWFLVFAARSKKEEMPGGGFTLLKIVVIIGMIKSCVIMLAGLVISVALVVSAWVSAVQSMVVAAVVTLVIMIVLTMLVVMYYFSYLAMLRTFRTNTQKGESYGAASGYVAVVYILMGLFGIIGLLSGIVNGEISGIVGSAGKIGWMLLMAMWIFHYRNVLGEIED